MATPNAALVKLEHGADIFDLNAAPWAPGRDFIPPAIGVSPRIADTTFIDIDDTQARDWNFSVFMRCDTEADGRLLARDLQEFLARAGDESEPLYLAFKPNSDFTFEPIWGQWGAFYRFTVLYGEAQIGEMYSDGTMPWRGFFLPVRLKIKPYALGLRQRAATATGFIFQNDKGGITFGFASPGVGGGNKFTNPYFGNSTWNTNWSASTNVISACNIAPKFVRHGLTSVKLTATSVTAGGNTFVENVNVGNTNTHFLSCYARNPDDSAVTSNDISMYYGGASLASTYTPDPFRDNWYIVEASRAGINAACYAGVSIKNKRTVYCDSFMLTENAFPGIPFHHGHMLGASWNGTAQNSATTRISAVMKVPNSDIFDIAQGWFSVGFKPFEGSACRTTDVYFFQDLSSSFAGYYAISTSDIRFTDGTNTIDTGTFTWTTHSAASLLDFCWHPGSGLKIYVNGVIAASGATYSPSATSGCMYIGSNAASAQKIGGAFLGFTAFNRFPNASQISDNYANLAPRLADNKAYDPPLFLWTADGDDTVDNCLDSFGSGRENYVVLGGVQGTAEPLIEIRGIVTNAHSQWLFGNVDVRPPDFMRPNNFMYCDPNETSSASTTESGSGYIQNSVTSTCTILTGGSPISPSLLGFRLLAGREVWAVARLYDDGSNLQFRSAFNDGTAAQLASDWLSIAASTTFFRFISLPLTLPTVESYFADTDYDQTAFNNISYTLYARRTAASAANIRLDYFLLTPNPLVFSPVSTTTIKALTWRTGEYGRESSEVAVGTGGVAIPIGGLRIVPNRYNIIVSVLGSHTDDPLVADTLSYRHFIATPRWILL